MTPDTALRELLARIGALQGRALLMTSEALHAWPVDFVIALKRSNLFAKAAPAQSVVCDGCEHACVMPVEVLVDARNRTRVFVVCDKRDDINRVDVPVTAIEQWQATGANVAAMVADLLQVTRAGSLDVQGNQWSVGLLRSAKHRAQIALIADGELCLTIVGHRVRFVDLLSFSTTGFAIDRREIERLVDHPVDGSSVLIETPEERRARLKGAVLTEKGKGNRAFLKTVAEREGFSVSRLKQLLDEEKTTAPAPSVWAGLITQESRTSSKKPRY